MASDGHHASQKEYHKDIPDRNIVYKCIQLRYLESVSALIHNNLCIDSGIDDQSVDVVAVLQYCATVQELFQIELLATYISSD